MPTKIKYQDDTRKVMQGILERAASDHRVVVSPLLRVASDGTSPWRVFFMVITKPFTITQVIVDPDEGAEWRFDFITALRMMSKDSLTIIHPYDELMTARAAERLWPCAAATRILKNVEAKYAEEPHHG